MQRLLSAAILVQTNQIDAATVDTIAHKLNMQWDLSNNCGPRPSWLKLDPPSVSTGHYSDNLLCDILDDHLYIPGYSCSGTCPDGLQRAEIICDCHSEMGPLQFIKQCEWTYQGEPCESHSEFFFGNFDWECNPMVQTCADGQYEVYEEPEVSSNEPEKQENLEAWTLETTVEEPEKSESWLESRPEMKDWPVQRLLRWANRKKTRKHISSEEKKIVDKIFELYGYLEKEENQMLSDVAPVRTESIFDQFETEEDENFDLGARLKEEVREVVESVSNYYFLHKKEEKDDLAVIMRLQAKVFRLREQLRTSQRRNHQLEEQLSQYEDRFFPK